MVHEQYMRRCLQLAANGAGHVSPNPMVGAVIVHNNRVIGEGYHTAYGEPHAEVNAIKAVTDLSLLTGSAIYVNLEPCSHFGKTPPCADLIIEHKIPRVVIASRDPFDRVDGAGISKLREKGIEVITGVSEAQARELNKRFFTFHEKKRPYIILKWAQTPDGFIDRIRKPGDTGINQITTIYSAQVVHGWRVEESAILIGHNTMINDNPQLTARWIKGRSPLRIILSNETGIKKDQYKVFNNEAKTVVLPADLQSLVAYCRENHVLSILVEGGASTLRKFLEAGLWDEARVFTGQLNFGSGLASPIIPGLPSSRQQIWGGDILTTYYNS